MSKHSTYILLIDIALVLLLLFVSSSQSIPGNESRYAPQPLVSFPLYIQSPIVDTPPMQQQPIEQLAPTQQVPAYVPATPLQETIPNQPQPESILSQRARQPKLTRHRYLSSARNLAGNVLPSSNQISVQDTAQPSAIANDIPVKDSVRPSGSNSSTCLYDKQYFKRLNECLAYKPYPTIGLPAFKNDDLLSRSEGGLKSGCSFILSNGLFKNQYVTRFDVDSDDQCINSNKVGINMSLSNATLYYLWTLRCLNRADQLEQDSTLDGTISNRARDGSEDGICVGSSQSFGFTVLQLSNINAQAELATDIYKNWRIVDINLSMLPTSNGGNRTKSSASQNDLLSSHIEDFAFETLDGDELNWRYLHLFRNWSLNRLHSNFLEQYRRYLWMSIQRCLSDSSEKLPVKLFDLFSNQHYQ